MLNLDNKICYNALGIEKNLTIEWNKFQVEYFSEINFMINVKRCKKYQ